ncbi:Ger(x)C family spore germination protein [Desulfosporosinus sp. PR]|uniref:Ger(x)C family spore germination protein n=1 Tax=Candidatus Desulfosporosinus nitrosoreducens TaxID=3401928 RepID=UPI0027F54851|nr:Ger(x)C family spore germination protein [Desulfosporosinus sp. PR]MDQ7095218.1 Ger(x)C family spore germination protein [Desulfosporosinus sp. PR]
MKRALSIISCILLLLLLPGCWNRRELNTLAIVQAVGVDLTDDGQISISLQILKPSAIKSSTTEKGSGSKSVWVVTSTGETVFDAIRNASMQTDRKAYFSHNTVYVLSEKLAREGLSDEIDLFGRDSEFRQLPYVFISRGNAEDIIRSNYEQEKIPGQAIEKLAKLTFASSKLPRTQLIDLLKNFASKTNDSIIPGINLIQSNDNESNEKSLKLEGTAILKRDKMIGWFDSKETRGILWILGDVKSGIIVVPTPGDETKKSAIEIIRVNSSVVPEQVDGNLVITVNVHAEGNLGEQMNAIDLVKPDSFTELENNMTEVIKAEINSAVDNAQKWDVDIFKFGPEVHRRFPKEWPELEKNWREEFKKIQVNVVVDSKLHWSGYLKKPIQSINDEGAESK